MNFIQRHMAKERDERGFTLIELLIVIIILGILAAVVIFAIGAVTDKGQLASCRTDAKTLRTGEEAAFNKTGGYKSETGLVAAEIITEPSELHNVSATGGTGADTAGASTNTAFAIVAEGKCEALSTTATPACAAPTKCYKP